MKVYLRNIKSTWRIYKQGRFFGMNVYLYMFKYTVRFIKNRIKKTIS